MRQTPLKAAVAVLATMSLAVPAAGQDDLIYVPKSTAKVFTTGSAGRCRIYYTMSTWDPYQVVVMRSDLKIATEAK
jgi:hypothetical protein